MFHVSITFREGPTILDADDKPVMIRRVAHTQDQVNAIQKCALALDAVNVTVTRDDG